MPFLRSAFAARAAGALLAATVGSAALLLVPQASSDDARALASYVDPASGERRTISVGAYEDHLFARYGRAELPGYVHALVLESEARRLGLALPEGSAAARAEEEWRAFVDQRFQGDPAAAARELVERGLSEAEFREQLAARARESLLEDAIVLATREVTPEAVAARFEREHGQDGVRVAVRHVYQSRARVEQDLIRAGARPDQLNRDAVDAELRRRLDALHAELAQGADLAELAQRASHDLATVNAGGVLTDYNYDRFGPELADAVRATEVGALFGPLLTSHGGHVGRVDSRTVTRLDDVRAALAAALASEPPLPEERDALRRRLLAAAELRPE